MAHARADGPHRFVCDDQCGRLRLVEIPCHVVDLPDGELQLDALTPFLEALPHTQYGLHARCEYRAYLIDDIGVILGMVLASLRMPDDDV